MNMTAMMTLTKDDVDKDHDVVENDEDDDHDNNVDDDGPISMI